MRSRYAAYALGLVDYIMQTTDPDGPLWRGDRLAWGEDIQRFSESTRFQGLTIQDASSDTGEWATVTFYATLRRGENDVSFGEKSTFRLINGRWHYTSGEPMSA